jgi:hypothetical protein
MPAEEPREEIVKRLYGMGISILGADESRITVTLLPNRLVGKI